MKLFAYLYLILHFFALTSLIAGLLLSLIAGTKTIAINTEVISKNHNISSEKTCSSAIWRWISILHFVTLVFHKPIYVMNVYTLFIHVWRPLSVALSVMTSHTLIFLSCIHHLFLFSSFCFMNKMIQQQQQHLYPYCIIHHQVSEGMCFLNFNHAIP